MKQINLTSASAAILIAALGASKAAAQTSPLIIDRGRIDRPQDQPQPAPQTEPLRGRTDVQDIAPAQPEEAAVPLTKVGVKGSSLPRETIGAAWQDKVGAPLTRALVEQIAAKLSAIYLKSDIALFTILAPAQDLTDGGLGLVVIEGHIAQVVIQADDKDARDLDLARSYAEKLTKERPLKRATLERYLSLIRDLPGEKIDAQLAPAAELGGAKLVLTAKRNRFDIGFGVNNRGTPLLGRTQVSLDASYNGLLRGGDQTSITFAAPTSDDLFTYAALSHSTPIGGDGLRLNLSASKLKTRLKIGIDGDAETFGASASYPLIRGYTKNLTATFGFDTLDSSNAAVGLVLDSSSTRVLRGSLSYGDSSANSSRGLSGSLSLGLDSLGADVNPYLGQADFTKFNVQAGWDHLWAGRYALRLRTAVQISGDMLPASEQMALGGESYGRAFEGAVIQGDQGIGASVETAVRMKGLLPDWMAGSETYAFADAGKVWLNERPFLYPDLDFSLSSAGIGSRFAIGKTTTLGLEASRGLKAPYPGVDEEWRFVYSLISRR